MKNLNVDEKTKSILDNNGFSQIPFDELADILKTEGFDPSRYHVDGVVSMPPLDKLNQMPQKGEGRWEQYQKLGQEAIDAGIVGAVILNGGMATRFGGTAKGVVPAFANRSFLDLKLSQVKKAGGGKVKAFLMNSFATDQITQDHLDGLNLNLDVVCFNQNVSLRLTEQGEPFLGDTGHVSLYSPGHGDFPFAFKASGYLDKFITEGGKYLTLSNVDNLAASLDPVVIGMHIASGNALSVELVDAYPGDVGGFPALVDGQLAILEALRLPPDFDVNKIAVFNTNTFVMDAAFVTQTPPLDWFAVKKTVEGRTAFQFERLVGQLSEHTEVCWLRVPRKGPESRFLPIKVPIELEQKQDEIKQVLHRLELI